MKLPVLAFAVTIGFVTFLFLLAFDLVGRSHGFGGYVCTQTQGSTG